VGHLPKVGEQIRVEDYLVTVVEADERVIGKLHFERVPENRQEDSPGDRLADGAAQGAFAS
jgi:Mg2+/Co2+ transporter CorC